MIDAKQYIAPNDSANSSINAALDLMQRLTTLFGLQIELQAYAGAPVVHSASIISNPQTVEAFDKETPYYLFFKVTGEGVLEKGGINVAAVANQFFLSKSFGLDSLIAVLGLPYPVAYYAANLPNVQKAIDSELEALFGYLVQHKPTPVDPFSQPVPDAVEGEGKKGKGKK